MILAWFVQKLRGLLVTAPLIRVIYYHWRLEGTGGITLMSTIFLLNEKGELVENLSLIMNKSKKRLLRWGQKAATICDILFIWSEKRYCFYQGKVTEFWLAMFAESTRSLFAGLLRQNLTAPVAWGRGENHRKFTNWVFVSCYLLGIITMHMVLESTTTQSSLLKNALKVNTTKFHFNTYRLKEIYFVHLFRCDCNIAPIGSKVCKLKKLQ